MSRVTEIAIELIELFNQQSGALDSKVVFKDWTHAQVGEYEHRQSRIRRLTEELATMDGHSHYTREPPA